MNSHNFSDKPIELPSIQQILTALGIYKKHAYCAPWPDSVLHLVPPDSFNPAQWFMNEMAERIPSDATLQQIETEAFRLGNSQYPNMKLRLSRIPEGNTYIFSIDSHDLVLQAEEGTEDHRLITELKAFNSHVNKTITNEWELEGIPTEHTYLRDMIRQKQKCKGRQS